MTKKKLPTITEDELRAEWINIGLQAFPDKGPEWKTSVELQAMWGCKKSTATDRIRRALDSGEIVREQKMVKQSDGAWRPMPCYRILPAKKGKQ